MNHLTKKGLLPGLLAGGAAVIALVLVLVFSGGKVSAEPANRVSIAGLCKLEATDFAYAPEGVTVSFRKPPDYNKKGTQRVKLLLTDAEGKTSKITAKLRLLRLRELKFELGDAPSLLTPQDLLLDSANHLSLSFSESPPSLGAMGEYAVTLQIDSQKFPLTIQVADTTAPSAKAISREGYPGQVWQPEDFVQNVTDRSAVTLQFAENPDFFLKGTQNITVILTDAGGNRTEISTTLKISGDAVAPVIIGAKDIEVERYSTVAYRAGVTAYDTKGTEIALQVDSSAVNTDLPGEYAVIYSAADALGQKTEVRIKVTVLPVGEATVAALADPVLDEIITEDMTDTQKAKAIHNWVVTNIAYSNEGEKENVLDGAYNGLSLRQGDCYTYYALAKYFLGRVGIESVDMTRIPGTDSAHYWLLLNLGEGWRHFDATRVKRSDLRPNNGFMMTASQAESFSKATNQPDFYAFDPSTLPEGVTIVP